MKSNLTLTFLPCIHSLTLGYKWVCWWMRGNQTDSNRDTNTLNANELPQSDSPQQLRELQTSEPRADWLIITEEKRQQRSLFKVRRVVNLIHSKCQMVCLENNNKRKKINTLMEIWQKVRTAKRGDKNETMREVQDTIGALEDDAALYHLSHDAPHWPDVHWKQKTHPHTQTRHTNTKILNWSDIMKSNKNTQITSGLQ